MSTVDPSNLIVGEAFASAKASSAVDQTALNLFKSTYTFPVE